MRMRAENGDWQALLSPSAAVRPASGTSRDAPAVRNRAPIGAALPICRLELIHGFPVPGNRQLRHLTQEPKKTLTGASSIAFNNAGITIERPLNQMTSDR
jgi:hypothetical protein